MEHQQIRFAAETIYRNIQPPQYTYARYDPCKATSYLCVESALPIVY